MNMIYIAYENRDFRVQIEYIFGIILSIYGREWQSVDYSDFHTLVNKSPDIVISYGKNKPPSLAKRHIHIYESDFFGENYLKPESIPTSVFRYYDLPVIYQGQGRLASWVIKSGDLIETNIDIIASSFFMLSRYEEVIQGTRDMHDRFPAKASLAYRQGFLNRPIVNQYAELLWSWIYWLLPDVGQEPLWPQNKAFAVCLTHDVDCLKKYSVLPPAMSIGSALLRKNNPGLAFRMSLDYLDSLLLLKKDPYDTFDYMLDMERQYEMTSSFYFLADDGSTPDSRYSITAPDVVKLIKKIENEGCEVGLHGSYDSYDDLEKMVWEKGNLDQIVNNKSYGCRQHYLRWRTPDTWRIQEKAGLLYDTTLTFAEHAGFRCGICLPFKPFDVIENRKLNIWELPLTVMEGSLQGLDYQNLRPEEAYKEIVELIKAVKRVHGVFVLLWHNSSFDSLNGWVGWKEVYEKVMKYISQQNVFVVSGREIVDFWSQRTGQGVSAV